MVFMTPFLSGHVPLFPILVKCNPPGTLLGALDEIQISVRRDWPVNPTIQSSVDIRHLVREIEPSSVTSHVSISRATATAGEWKLDLPEPPLPVGAGKGLGDERR